MGRPVELIGGGLAAGVGLSASGIVVLIEGAVWAVVLLTLSGLGAGLGAFRHVLYGETFALALLWASAVTLTTLTFVALSSIGLIVLPGAIAATAAAVAGASRHTAGTANS